MKSPKSSVERIVVVGGGFAGLASATQLAQAGFPVTLIEASELGYAASTKNQGWLHSGASFAKANSKLAERCYRSMERTLEFCPDCIEPDARSMIYGSLDHPSNVEDWTSAWDQAGIPYHGIPTGERSWDLPQVDRDQFAWLLRLPDCSFRPQILLETLANTARSSGVEIRSGTFVSSLLIDESRVFGVRVGASEEVRAQLVVLAIGAASGKLFSPLFMNAVGQQEHYELAYVKTHLIAVSPASSVNAFHLTGTQSFNHLPHGESSVFGTDRWMAVQDLKDNSVDPHEIKIIEDRVSRILPGAFENAKVRKEWAGVTVQAMHLDEVDPAHAFRPTVIDHAQQPHGIENVISIFPGRATLWAELAARVQDAAFEKTKRAPTTTSSPPWAFTNE